MQCGAPITVALLSVAEGTPGEENAFDEYRELSDAMEIRKFAGIGWVQLRQGRGNWKSLAQVFVLHWI